MAYDFLVDQALKRIWAGTRQDTQSIVKPKRVTPFNGRWNTVHVADSEYVLPVKNKRFHVYQIGQLYPTLMGLFPYHDAWVSIAENCEKQKMLVNIYNREGIELPRYAAWYLVTPNKNLLIAIQQTDSIDINLNEEELFFRVYSHAYFRGSRYGDVRNYVRVIGKTVESFEDISILKEEYERQKDASLGTPYLYINGRKSNVLSFDTVTIGDAVEIVLDSSVYRFVEFKVQGLPTFDSIRDLKRKYLLHYRTNSKTTEIDYNDDIDVYIVRKDPAGVKPFYSGFYYHRNKDDSFRNVTHRDYSIAVPYVESYINQSIPHYGDNPSREGWYIQLYIRHSGWVRGVPYIHNRIHELYKLPDARVQRALLGLDSVVPEWRADNLENSAYMRVMSHDGFNIDPTLVEDAWGYNAVSKLVGDTPSKVELFSGQESVALPLILRRYSTGFEYDAQGVLIRHYSHTSGDRYITRNTATKLVEMIGGYGSVGLDESYNQLHTPYDPEFEYRVYRKLKLPNNQEEAGWRDVTGDTTTYTIDKVRNLVSWKHDMTKYDTVVRSNKNILVQEEEILMDDGLLYIQMTQVTSRTGSAQKYVMEIPTGEVDVFLNGYSLVEGVDYYVDFPNICIVNKTFLLNPRTDKQRILIRSYGFADTNLKRQDKDDSGFVRYGVLSRNKRFDLREDRVMRMVVGGRLIHKSDLKFSEEETGTYVTGFRDGLPYEVKDIIVPMRNLIGQDGLAYRLRSQETDKRISDYMSQFMSDPVKDRTVGITSLWPVYSPFCSQILFDLKSGVLDNTPIRSHYDDNFILEYTKPYQHLLRVDPTQDDVRADTEFVEVHPIHLTSTVNLDIYQYQFMERMVSLLLKDRVDLSAFVQVSQGQ